MKKALLPLLAGDALTLALITLIGFGTHGELKASQLLRMMATFLPLAAGWFLISPWLGLFDPQVTSKRRQLWRPVLAMLLGAPIMGVLRAAMLHSVVLPVFVLILGGVAALGLLVWRTIWFFLDREEASE